LRANHWQWRRRILGQRRLYSVKRCSVLVGSGGIGTDGITAEDGQVNRKYCFPVRKGREALDDPLLFTGLEGVSVRSTSYNGLDIGGHPSSLLLVGRSLCGSRFLFSLIIHLLDGKRAIFSIVDYHATTSRSCLRIFNSFKTLRSKSENGTVPSHVVCEDLLLNLAGLAAMMQELPEISDPLITAAPTEEQGLISPRWGLSRL